jgi:hypothetical protein
MAVSKTQIIDLKKLVVAEELLRGLTVCGDRHDVEGRGLIMREMPFGRGLRVR